MIVIRPLRRDDVAAAIQVLLGGTFSPEAEDATQEERYWSAAVGVQSNGGVVLVADDDGCGVCEGSERDEGAKNGKSRQGENSV